jgi:hypothetical protein
MYATLVEAVEVNGGEQLTVDVRIEVEGQERPCCVAQPSGGTTTSTYLLDSPSSGPSRSVC